MEAVHYLTIDRHCQIGAINGDLVIVPFTDRVHHEGTIGRPLEGVDRASPVDCCAIGPGEFVDLYLEAEIDADIRRIVVALVRRIWEADRRRQNCRRARSSSIAGATRNVPALDV